MLTNDIVSFEQLGSELVLQRFDLSLLKCLWNAYKSPPDKTNLMTVHPVKTQITLGIRPVWSESSLALNG